MTLIKKFTAPEWENEAKIVNFIPVWAVFVLPCYFICGVGLIWVNTGISRDGLDK